MSSNPSTPIRSQLRLSVWLSPRACHPPRPPPMGPTSQAHWKAARGDPAPGPGFTSPNTGESRFERCCRLPAGPVSTARLEGWARPRGSESGSSQAAPPPRGLFRNPDGPARQRPSPPGRRSTPAAYPGGKSLNPGALISPAVTGGSVPTPLPGISREL